MIVSVQTCNQQLSRWGFLHGGKVELNGSLKTSNSGVV